MSFGLETPFEIAIDPNGNLTQKTENGEVWTYEWNAENELIRVCKDVTPCTDPVAVATFKYDPLGRRIEKIAGGLTYSYLYDGEDVSHETRSGGLEYSYVHGPGFDEPLTREDGAGGQAYYHDDALGSIVATTSGAGAVVSQYRYGVWGRVEVGASQGSYSFTGREWDPETGLHYYRGRYYDPEGGRFISEDALKVVSGFSSYWYVDNNPATDFDPTGFAPQSQRPNNLPLGTPRRFWKPFQDGFSEAVRRLNRQKCRDFFSDIALPNPCCPDPVDTMRNTEYRFVPMTANPGAGAGTSRSKRMVFINTKGAYMTARTGGFYLPDGSKRSLGNVTNFRAFLLLHELGHQLDACTGFGPDDADPILNQKQSLAVIKACF